MHDYKVCIHYTCSHKEITNEIKDIVMWQWYIYMGRPLGRLGFLLNTLWMYILVNIWGLLIKLDLSYMKTCVSLIKAITMIKEINAGLEHVTILTWMFGLLWAANSFCTMAVTACNPNGILGSNPCIIWVKPF